MEKLQRKNEKNGKVKARFVMQQNSNLVFFKKLKLIHSKVTKQADFFIYIVQLSAKSNRLPIY